MANVSEVTNTTLSGLNHIDSLLDIGPDWNFLTSGPLNTLYFTFSISSGTEAKRSGQEAFTPAQQSATRVAFADLQKITGITFAETAIGSNAHLHLANIDIEGSNTTGLASWASTYSPEFGPTLTSYSANAWIYLDNVEYRAANSNLTPGTSGYQTLLHELGHALGLKHTFEEESGDIYLPKNQDNTAFSIMSYTSVGGPYSAFSPYDIAALNWLYGGDGLGGARGMNSTGGGRYITGTAGADRLTGTSASDTIVGAAGDDLILVSGGNDLIQGGAGTDTVVFSRIRDEYTVGANAAGETVVAHTMLGTATMSGVEYLTFMPVAPTIAVSKNAAGYLYTGSTPVVSGQTEVNALVRLYNGDRPVGEGYANEKGFFSIAASPFADGVNYSIRATVTDAAGNVSPSSEAISFNVDATPPGRPSSSMSLAAGGNQPIFEGTGEAGTTIQLINATAATEIGRTVVKADGTWRVDSAALPNGKYDVLAASVDIADNATSAPAYLDFTINSTLNLSGDGIANRFTPGAGNNAIDGMAGLDTAVYGGARTGFTIERGVYGVTVKDKSGALGTDNLINVERIQFGDTMVALDVDGAAGQVYRLYRAAFDRVPDQAGLAFWIKAFDTGQYTLNDIAKFFLDDKEAKALYSQDPSDSYFVTKLYAHVLHRPAEGAGFKYWVDGLQEVSRSQVLAFFTESPENQAQVIGAINNGIEYPLSPA